MAENDSQQQWEAESESASGATPEPAAVNAEDAPIVEDSFEASPINFRILSQIYSDQASLFRRTTSAIENVFFEAEAAGPSILFDFTKDPLQDLLADNSIDLILEEHARIIDLMVLVALGQAINVIEFQDHAKTLVALYTNFPFLAKAKNSSLKDQALRELEEEWQAGSDFLRVQQFFQATTAAVESAAQYCDVDIAPLPEF